MKEKRQNKSNTKKIRTIALSIFLAVVVWLMVVYVNDPDITTTITDIKVSFVGMVELEDKNLIVTGKDNLPQMSIVVTGKRSDLMNFMDDISVQIDVSSINAAGEYNMRGKLYMPTTRITVEKEKYGDFPITVENISEKEIDVELSQTGTQKDKLVKSVMTNPKVKIKGAKSEIDNVAGAQAVVDISKIQENDVEFVNYVLVDTEGELIEKNETIESMQQHVEVKNTIYNMKKLPVVPVLSEEIESDYILDWNSVEVSPSEITVGADDSNTVDKLEVKIDKIGASDEEYEITEPDGIYIPEESKKARVKANTVKNISEYFEVDVEAENVPENMKARIDRKIGVNVWSGRRGISANDIHAVVDVSGLGAGVYNLPVKLSGENMEFHENYTVDVTIEGV